jgi:hypothetical protein
MHRVLKETDFEKCVTVEYDIADYRTAEELRKLSEQYVRDHVLPRLQSFETDENPQKNL